jgi:branched-chain amino acid transport system permease protein
MRAGEGDAMEVLQLLLSGLANGCVYGLIALGFVLIYKATEAVNFAQGDFMMLGAFVMIGLVNPHFMGINFWLAVPLALLIMGALGYLLDITMLRQLFGQNQIAIVILTIALGFVIRFVAGVIWGHEPLNLHSPLALGDVRFGGVVLSLADIAVITVTVILTLMLWQFFQRTKLGLAMQAASQNQMAAYYMGIPVKRVQGAVWALAAIVACVAGILYASKGAVDVSAGFIGIKAFAAAVIGGFGSLPAR